MIDDEEARARFILSQTTRAPVAFVPELTLLQATAVTPLWHEAQDFLDRHDLEPPYWAFAWPGGVALARYILDHPSEVRGRSVLDFGSGSGLVAIAAAIAGARSVTAVERDVVGRTAIRLNARAHSVELAVTDSPPEGPFECYLGGDLFYEQEPAREFAGWFRARARRGARVLVGDPGRAYAPADFVLVEEVVVPTSPDLESTATMRARVMAPAPSRSLTRP
jgi:predicted nicotinamide N-methyase